MIQQDLAKVRVCLEATVVTLVEFEPEGDTQEEIEDEARAYVTGLFDQGAIENFDFTAEPMQVVEVEIQ